MRPGTRRPPPAEAGAVQTLNKPGRQGAVATYGTARTSPEPGTKVPPLDTLAVLLRALNPPWPLLDDSLRCPSGRHSGFWHADVELGDDGVWCHGCRRGWTTYAVEHEVRCSPDAMARFNQLLEDLGAVP